MTHYGVLKGANIWVEMSCTHPDLKNNSAGDIACAGDCQSCKHGMASTDIKTMLALMSAAGVTR